MPLEIAAPSNASAPLPLQFVDVKITPLMGGQFAVAVGATLLDEEQLEFVGQDLANVYVDTLDEALDVIRKNVAVLKPPPLPAVA
jgi:hypothetical protein